METRSAWSRMSRQRLLPEPDVLPARPPIDGAVRSSPAKYLARLMSCDDCGVPIRGLEESRVRLKEAVRRAESAGFFTKLTARSEESLKKLQKAVGKF